jgi:hypothetical protein
VGVIVGDVSGHGREALPHTALLRFTLRAYLEAGLSPRSSLQRAAPVLERQLGESLATVVLAAYDPRERTLIYSSAGHPPPIVMGSRALPTVTACSAPPIGASQPTGTRQTTVSIPGGSLACFYTDGLIESRVRGELFGSRRLERLISVLPSGSSARDLLDRVEDEADRRPDDMAACLLSVEGSAIEPVVLLEELELDRREADRTRVERFLHSVGLGEPEAQEVLRSVRASVARNGRIVLEVHLGRGRPEIVIKPQNISILEPSLRESARVGGM